MLHDWTTEVVVVCRPENYFIQALDSEEEPPDTINILASV